MSHNLFVDQLLMFYSQSEAGNGLTRGLETEIARRTYVPTRLDRQLKEAILAGGYRLVILTGNAGDGKTAFIQKLEEAAAEEGASVAKKDSLGSSFSLNARPFKTLYDGSVEFGGIPNLQMLSTFFADFQGDTAPATDTCLVVAMNEGKLLDFLSHTTKFGWLSKTLLAHLHHNTPLPEDIVLVNLNLRSVVDASRGKTDSLFDQILDRYVADEFWTACDSCPARHRCPIKFNVDTFRLRPPVGLSDNDRAEMERRNQTALIARSRLKSIFQMLHFRQRIHVTVRDLRSVLAFALFGKHTCQQIEAEVATGQANFIDRYYYNAIFNSKEKDRVLSLLREFDVGLASSPIIDSQISFSKPMTADFQKLFLSFEHSRQPALGRSLTDSEDLMRLYKDRPMSPEERTTEALMAARQYVASLRRKLFFEGLRVNNDGSLKRFLDELVPYENVDKYMDFIDTKDDPQDCLKQAVVMAISRSESICDEHRGRENICIRTRHDATTDVRAFFTYPAQDFALEVESPPAQAGFVEFLPSSIHLRHLDRNIVLVISLDLYEMLMRIRDGYVPAAGEMRAFFLNLLMFKKQLMSMPSNRLLLTGGDYSLYQVSRTLKNGIAVTNPS